MARNAVRRLAPVILAITGACAQGDITAPAAPVDRSGAPPVIANTSGTETVALATSVMVDVMVDLRDRVSLSTPRSFRNNTGGKIDQVVAALQKEDWNGARAAMNNVRSAVDGVTDPLLVAEMDVFRVALDRVTASVNAR